MLSRLVNIMVSLELRFVQEKAEDGQLVYRLDPSVLVPLQSPVKYQPFTPPNHSPIDVFVTYDGKRAADIAVSRYAVRQLVAGEARDILHVLSPSSEPISIFLAD